MKMVFVFLLLIMAVMVVNAQTTNACDSTRTNVEIVDLQRAITDNITRDYVDYTIIEATRVSVKNIVTYEVVIVNGDITETLVYDNDGVFIKKRIPSPVENRQTIF